MRAPAWAGVSRCESERRRDAVGSGNGGCGQPTSQTHQIRIGYKNVGMSGSHPRRCFRCFGPADRNTRTDAPADHPTQRASDRGGAVLKPAIGIDPLAKAGAGGRNRTDETCLEGRSFATKLRPRKRRARSIARNGRASSAGCNRCHADGRREGRRSRGDWA